MNMLRKSETYAPLERADQAKFAKTRALFAYWQTLQATGRPTRASLDPFEMKPCLSNLLTGDIETRPFRVLYRLVGTLVAEYTQCDFSNRYLDELDYSGRDDVDWERCYREIHRTRQPLIGECSLRGAAGRIIASYEYAILPLWRGEDPAGSFVAIEVYDDVDTRRIPDWTRVTVKRSEG